MPLIDCPDCGRKVSEMASACPDCGRPISTNPLSANLGHNLLTWSICTAFCLAILALLIGGFRVYYGGGIGFKLVPKYSFGYKDTIVNLDDILGQPRIVVATQHPQVKRQLEEMGLIESDEKAMQEQMRKIQKQSEELMRQWGLP